MKEKNRQLEAGVASSRARTAHYITMSSPFEKESQQQAIALVHSASGLLSTIGSSLIFSSVMVLRRKQPLSSFQRLLLGLSTYDLLHSLAVTATTLPVRSDADVWGASGTVATCTVSYYNMCYFMSAIFYVLLL